MSLSTGGEEIILNVKDDGRGIPSEILQNFKDSGAGGVGLAGMRERVREIGGHLEIHSNSVGTEVVVRVPVRQRLSRPLIRNVEDQEVVG